jgi:hypothetical protein
MLQHDCAMMSARTAHTPAAITGKIKRGENAWWVRGRSLVTKDLPTPVPDAMQVVPENVHSVW